MRWKMLDLQCFESKNSILVAFERDKNCPFTVCRVFYLYHTSDDVIRGQHANRDSEFLMVAVNGSCRVSVSDGVVRQEFLLDSPLRALYLDKMVWKEMFDFSNDCVLLVLTNTSYSAKEYIYDYEVFLKECGGGGEILLYLNPVFLNLICKFCAFLQNLHKSHDLQYSGFESARVI